MVCGCVCECIECWIYGRHQFTLSAAGAKRSDLTLAHCARINMPAIHSILLYGCLEHTHTHTHSHVHIHNLVFPGVIIPNTKNICNFFFRPLLCNADSICLLLLFSFSFSSFSYSFIFFLNFEQHTGVPHPTAFTYKFVLMVLVNISIALGNWCAGAFHNSTSPTHTHTHMLWLLGNVLVSFA